MANSQISGTDAKSLPAVPLALNTLEATVQHLENTLLGVSSRLVTVLDALPISGQGTNPVPETEIVAERISRCTVRISQCTENLNGILNRLHV
jgi:hypothetical protein